MCHISYYILYTISQSFDAYITNKMKNIGVTLDDQCLCKLNE